jgi:O-antigen ligase
MTYFKAQEPPELPDILLKRGNILVTLVGAYIILLPYQFQIGKTMNIAPSDCLLLLAVVFGVGRLKWIKTVWTHWHLAIALSFVFGSLVCALNFGVLASYELVNKDAGLLVPFISYFVITSAVSDWGRLRTFLRIFVLSVVFENILAIGAYFAAHFFGVMNSFAQYEGLRLSGMLLDPNAYGGLLATALVICEAASSGSAPLFRSATLILSRMTLATGLLLTFSRSAWLGLGLALLVLCFLRTRLVGRFIVSLFLGAPFLLLLVGPKFLTVIQEMASRPKQVQERFDLIQFAIEGFKRHPIFGGGLGSFRLTVGEIAHNSAMWFLADFGFLGLGVFLGFLGWFFAKAWEAYQSAPSHQQPLVLALLLAHTTMVGVAMGIEAFYQRHWWFVFALIASAYTVSRRSRLNSQEGCLKIPEFAS